MEGEKNAPIELKFKSGKTIFNSYFDNLEYWHQLAAVSKEEQRWKRERICSYAFRVTSVDLQP